MPNLTDFIEEYLKKLLALSSNRYIEIKRRELACKFTCVPSQINYVLERRFSLERGYLVESRRGGSGCIRIYRIDEELLRSWQDIIDSSREEEFEPLKIKGLLKRMSEEKIISRREACVLDTLLHDKVYYGAGINELQTRKLQRGLFTVALEELLKIGY